MTDEELIESLAAREHAGWAHWMKYLFSCCIRSPDGSMTIPAEYVRRWQRQASSSYKELTEQEKQSDRDEVARILPIIFPRRYSEN